MTSDKQIPTRTGRNTGPASTICSTTAATLTSCDAASASAAASLGTDQSTSGKTHGLDEKLELKDSHQEPLKESCAPAISLVAGPATVEACLVSSIVSSEAEKATAAGTETPVGVETPAVNPQPSIIKAATGPVSSARGTDPVAITSTIPSTIHRTSNPNSCCAAAASKKGFQPCPQHKVEPQIDTLQAAVYQPAEYNSFQHPVSPTGPAVFDISALNAATSGTASNMIFSEIYRSRKASLAKTMSNQSTDATSESLGFDPDLLSRDKTKQRLAIVKHLCNNVRTDWDFPWTRTDVPALPVVVRHVEVDGVMTEIRYHDPEVSPTSTAATPTVPLADVLKQSAEETNTQASEAESASEDEDNDDPQNLDDDNDDVASLYSVVDEDPSRFKIRLDWDSEIELMAKAAKTKTNTSSKKSMESAISVLEARVRAKDQRRRAVQEEMKWNQGLACFEARRDKWTGAKLVRMRPAMSTTAPPPPPAATSPLSPLSPRRFFARYSNAQTVAAISSASGTPPTAAGPGSDSDAMNPASKVPTNASATISTTGSVSASSGSARGAASVVDSRKYPLEVMLPIAEPLIPAANPMRASIGPRLYLAIYDKTILQSQSPSCPINLKDMLAACVTGWKRDGEWPPKAAPVEVRKKRTGEGREQIRRGFQKVFGLQ